MAPSVFDEAKVPLYDDDSDLDLDLDLEDALERSAVPSRLSRGFVLLNTAILALSLFFFGLSLRKVSPTASPTSLNAMRETSYYCTMILHNYTPQRILTFLAPLFDQIDMRLETVQINGTLLNTSPPSIYRMDPSPEVDAAWDRIANVRTSAVSRADVLKLGKDPAVAVKYPPSFGLGDDAYVAEVDVFHQIHCLDALRREIHFEHYHASQFPDGKPSALHRMHTSHCIYILLQNLMCSASVDVIVHEWRDVQRHPFPDFNINKKCRNFDAVLAWQEQHAVADAPYHLLRRPAGMDPVATSDEFKDAFHQWDYEMNDDLHVR